MFHQKNRKLNSYLLTLTFGFLTFVSNSSTLLAATPDEQGKMQQQQYQAGVLLKEGNRQLINGRLSSALAYLRESLSIYQELGDRPGIANVYYKLGQTYFTIGKYQAAVDNYQRSLDILEDLNDKSSIVQVLDNLSNIYFTTGKIEQGKKYRQQAIALRKEVGNPIREGAFLGNVGLNQEVGGEYKKALIYYRDQLAIAQQKHDPLLQADAYKNLGGVYRQLGKYAEAIENYHQELILSRELSDRLREGLILERLAATYIAQGNVSGSITFYQQQLDLSKKFPDQVSRDYLIKQLGRAYLTAGKSEQALAVYQEQLSNAKTTKNIFRQGLALNNLAYAFLKIKKFAEAENALAKNTKIWQSFRETLSIKDDFGVEQADTYKLLQQLFITQKRFDSALEMAEEGSTVDLVYILRKRLIAESAGSGLNLIPKEIKPPSLGQIQEIAKSQNATLIKYTIIPEEGIYTYVIQPTGKFTFRLLNPKTEKLIPPTDSLTDIVASIPTALGVNIPNFQLSKNPISLLQLHQLLIKPINDLLPKNPQERIIFIPQNELLLIPFPALAEPAGKYLIEKHTISIAPAIQVLKLTKQRRSQTGGSKVVVVGNPIMPTIAQAIGAIPQPLTPLVTSEKEALEIADLFKTKAFIGNRATKAILTPLLPNAKIIHFATFGLLDDITRKGIPGAISLSAVGSDDGIFTASEIIDLYAQPKGKHLKAELVVISSGEIGTSKNTGNGIVGLSLALISAGIPSLVVSQWTAPDANTDVFMNEFYRQFQKNPNKAEALRNTMLIMIKKYPNPKFWAGYSLIGEAK